MTLTHCVGLFVVSAVGLSGCARHAPHLDNPAVGHFSNPIIAGFAPDPSIVRVEDDFYLVNSTFEYFPGIPIYHSKDLVNWELIGHALNEPDAIELAHIASSGGIHASTIRYSEGIYYVITTNVVDSGTINFVVTATDPRGPWSLPSVIDGAPGIDPSLFFDDDGRAWYVGNHIPLDQEFPGQAEIWLQEIDIEAMMLIGDRHYLWRGCCGGAWAEGPHIYKKDGYYNLVISEGGTAYEHALSVAISRDITGPYQNNPRNPVLSHRQLSYDYPITGVGHADLVELEDGRWYAVALGWRLVDGLHGILGRETFLLPVKWETEPYAWKEDKLTFPVFSPATGKIELHYSTPFGGDVEGETRTFVDDFEKPLLDVEWNFRRAPLRTFHDLTSVPGQLRLELQPGAISERTQYSFVGIRQRHFEFEAVTRMTFAPDDEDEEAGLIVIQNDRSAYLLTLTGSAAGHSVQLKQSLHGESRGIAKAPADGKSLYLRATGDYLNYRFEFSSDGISWTSIGGDIDGTSLSPSVIEGFNYTGVYVGLYASSNDEPTDNHADFDFFRYEPRARSRDGWFHRQVTGE